MLIRICHDQMHRADGTNKNRHHQSALHVPKGIVTHLYTLLGVGGNMGRTTTTTGWSLEQESATRNTDQNSRVVRRWSTVMQNIQSCSRVCNLHRNKYTHVSLDNKQRLLLVTTQHHQCSVQNATIRRSQTSDEDDDQLLCNILHIGCRFIVMENHFHFTATAE